MQAAVAAAALLAATAQSPVLLPATVGAVRPCKASCRARTVTRTKKRVKSRKGRWALCRPRPCRTTTLAPGKRTAVSAARAACVIASGEGTVGLETAVDEGSTAM
eukprot:347518-Pelagomonas_calceolata.AAC.1